jgi:hypothetical protein
MSANESPSSEPPSKGPSATPEPVKEALKNIVQAPESDSDMQERRLNYLYFQVPEKHRSSNVRDVIKQFLQESDDYIIRNIQYTVKQNPENFAGYLYKALENDFAKNSNSVSTMSKEERNKLRKEWWDKKIDEAISTMSEQEKQKHLQYVEQFLKSREVKDTPEMREKIFRDSVQQDLVNMGVKSPYDP